MAQDVARAIVEFANELEKRENRFFVRLCIKFMNLPEHQDKVEQQVFEVVKTQRHVTVKKLHGAHAALDVQITHSHLDIEFVHKCLRTTWRIIADQMMFMFIREHTPEASYDTLLGLGIVVLTELKDHSDPNGCQTIFTTLDDFRREPHKTPMDLLELVMSPHVKVM